MEISTAAFGLASGQRDFKAAIHEGLEVARIDILDGWFTVALPSTYGEHREH